MNKKIFLALLLVSGITYASGAAQKSGIEEQYCLQCETQQQVEALTRLFKKRADAMNMPEAFLMREELISMILIKHFAANHVVRMNAGKNFICLDKINQALGYPIEELLSEQDAINQLERLKEYKKSFGELEILEETAE